MPVDLTPTERSLRASIASNARWSRERDRSAATARAREAALARFEDEVDPDRTLDPATRAKLAENARRAHFQRLAFRSARARRAKAGQNA